MPTNKTRVLLILPQDVLDRARGLAGKATTTFKLPVSLQIVLRALIEEGLRRDGDPALLANIEGQAKAVRHLRTIARQPWRLAEAREHPSSAARHRASGRERTDAGGAGAGGSGGPAARRSARSASRSHSPRGRPR
jgi:hypothetical protein